MGATKEPGEPNHAKDIGGASVWWTWTAPASGVVNITTADSDFDTLLAVYTGSSLTSLVPVASNDDEDATQITSEVSFFAQAGTTYVIAIDGLFDEQPATGLIKFTLAMNLPPSIDSIRRMPDGSLTFRISGVPNRVYAIEASPSFSTWIEIGRRLNSSGTVEFTDERAVQLQNLRFYRVRESN